MAKFKNLYDGWGGNPPSVLFIAEPWPDGVYLPLTGGGSARMSPDDFEAGLKADLEAEQGNRYHVNVWEGDPEDIADRYALVSWQRLEDQALPHQAVFILYYEPVSEARTLEKHMPEFLEEYLQEHPWARAEVDEVEAAAVS